MNKLEKGFIYLQAAIAGLLGAEMQKKAYDMVGKEMEKSVLAPNPLMQLLKKKEAKK